MIFECFLLLNLIFFWCIEFIVLKDKWFVDFVIGCIEFVEFDSVKFFLGIGGGFLILMCVGF